MTLARNMTLSKLSVSAALAVGMAVFGASRFGDATAVETDFTDRRERRGGASDGFQLFDV
jgi:hypothetical protein